jgi:hypothetical protein
MDEAVSVGEIPPGGFAVVVPVDLGQEVRVIEWPGGDGLSTLYREIGCRTVDLQVVGDLAFWVDDEGAMGEDWAANSRVAWLLYAGRLGLVEPGDVLLFAGTVVITLAAPDGEGDTQGMTREWAERLAVLARSVPAHDQDRLTARLQALVARGSLVMTLDENGVPDGFVV